MQIYSGGPLECQCEIRSHKTVPYTVDSKKLEYGPGAIYAGFPSSLAFGVGGPSYSNLLVSSIWPLSPHSMLVLELDPLGQSRPPTHPAPQVVTIYVSLTLEYLTVYPPMHLTLTQKVRIANSYGIKAQNPQQTWSLSPDSL